MIASGLIRCQGLQHVVNPSTRCQGLQRVVNQRVVERSRRLIPFPVAATHPLTWMDFGGAETRSVQHQLPTLRANLPSTTRFRFNIPSRSFLPNSYGIPNSFVAASTAAIGVKSTPFIESPSMARGFTTTSEKYGSGRGSGSGSGGGSGNGKGSFSYGRRDQGISLIITGVVIFVLKMFCPYNLHQLLDMIGSLCVVIGAVLIVLSFL